CAEVARTLWDANRGEIDLLFSDLALPEGSSGVDLARQFQLAKPGLKVVYAGSSTGEGEAKSVVLNEPQPFIGKPYTAQQFIEVIEKAIEKVDNDPTQDCASGLQAFNC